MKWKLPIIVTRLILLMLACIPLYFYNNFYDHFYAYLTGNVINGLIVGHWHIVLLSILLFLAFLIPLSYRRKANWAEYGIVTAFFVSLFVEMYGIPFTILFAQHWFYDASIQHPSNLLNFHLFGTYFGLDIPMAYAACLIITGAALIITAWITLYTRIKKDHIVMHGIYAFSRHPQYLGFILIIVGWMIGWPSAITLIFAPVLIYKYIMVCRSEEQELNGGDNYIRYCENVPFLI